MLIKRGQKLHNESDQNDAHTTPKITHKENSDRNVQKHRQCFSSGGATLSDFFF